MAKTKTAYLCEECGAHSVKWAGQCPECLAWNTLSETTIGAGEPVSASVATKLTDLGEGADTRYPTGFEEFDRVLGGDFDLIE